MHSTQSQSHSHSQSPDAARRTHRRKPELNINTSPTPSTPPPRPKAGSASASAFASASTAAGTAAASAVGVGRALRVPTGTTRDAVDMETFLEALTPVDNPAKENDRPDPPRPSPRRPNPRDSHDLSLSPRQVTRDSLVTNMLLSLDQLSMGQISSPPSDSRLPYDDPTMFSSFGNDDGRTMTFNSRSGRGNGHGYSYSSDLEGADDASRASSQPSRGRRSNSSSGFQSSLGRINSLRETSHQRNMPGSSKALHSRGGKGSKSSSTASIDQGYAQVMGSQRWARGFGKRSSSFDGEARPIEPIRASTASPQSPWHIEFSKSFFNGAEYEAAPTPTIPAGPRRLATVPSLPILPPPEPKVEQKPLGVERRRSARSSKSATVGRSREPPAIPDFDLGSAPAPHVGYEKSKEVAPSNQASAAQQTKEKPTFWRRWKNTFTGPSAAASKTVETSASRSPSVPPQAKPSSAPPSRDSQQPAAPQTLHKKASFFRRRKQSFTESEPPPLPPLTVPTIKGPVEKTQAMGAKPDASPITSLRRAMDPFLQGSPTTPDALTPTSALLPTTEKAVQSSSPEPTGTEEDRARNVRGFSPDYEPSPKAVIRKVDPEPADVAGHDNRQRMESPSRQAPQPPSSPPKSFLQDDSDSDCSPRRERKLAVSESGDKGLMPTHDSDRRARTPSPSMSKSKSSPNLGRPKVALRLDSKLSPISSQSSQKRDSNSMGLPIEGFLADGNHADAVDAYRSANSLPSLRVDSAEPSPRTPGTVDSNNQSGKSIDEPDFVVGEPTEDDRQKAQKIFDGNEDYISKERAAAWMGEEGIVRQRTLRAYMELYEFENQSILNSLRQLCQRLLLRAETQQVDRILVAFSNRWCECNPNHGFRATDIIHTICYSIILLNTDLHMADIEHKMTKSQFIKNTMTTIRQSLQEVVPDAFERPSILPGKGHSLGVDGDQRTSGDNDRHMSFRASFRPSARPGSALGAVYDHANYSSHHSHSSDGCGPLVKAPFDGPLRAWESQVEIVLREIYTSIRDDRLPLFGGAETSLLPIPGSHSMMSMLKRSPSVLSKAPSDVGSTRGRITEGAKHNSSRWNSKSRSRPRGFGTGFSSSRTSFDDGNSMWSPTESSATWSKASLGRTHTTMSMDSFGSSYPRGDYQQSIGFANALSQAIIREDNTLDISSIRRGSEGMKNEQLLDDESLELLGPPWMKEGIVTHKHQVDGVEKRPRDRNWTEVFAVIQKGQLSMFSFSPNKSHRNKSRSRAHGNGALAKGAVVGGGNWQENATNLGTFSLRQTLASALPPPGYSRTRPHVWALSLPSGAVHLFQVGTAELINEFVSTANYWSARLSTHPLVGGISNIEYGWSEAIIQNELVTAINESTAPNGHRPGTGSISGKGHSRPGSGANNAIIAAAIAGRSSMQSRSSMRSSSFDFGIPRPGSGSSGVLGTITGSGGGTIPRHHGKLPGDKVHIAEWTPPAQSLRPSNFSEEEQLRSLERYVENVKQEHEVHNGLRSPMLLAFTPRGANAIKAMANWEKRSEYLLREVIKFETYVDCLRTAGARRTEVELERVAREAEEEGGKRIEVAVEA
ncbi:hypothetical protein B0T22DRAFT_182686 [Podospora appendiculata]|uniref:SEC7 domain-containing protein n=1 Tax=Podospora appendiculata TaxID=314037 RepID=A0AAE0XC64_9PEZI|nr:hypothetical protein B0T22DRAFT_182686 [Podospora appendiculata]